MPVASRKRLSGEEIIDALLGVAAWQVAAAEPEWGPSRVKDCDRECLVGFMDNYMNAIYQHDPKAANSYFDALEGDDGKIAAFADDCARHENGYQTVNNPPPGGRMMPAPPLPNPDTPQGNEQLKCSPARSRLTARFSPT
jgi:hypothetical protein